MTVYALRNKTTGNFLSVYHKRGPYGDNYMLTESYGEGSIWASSSEALAQEVANNPGELNNNSISKPMNNYWEDTEIVALAG